VLLLAHCQENDIISKYYVVNTLSSARQVRVTVLINSIKVMNFYDCLKDSNSMNRTSIKNRTNCKDQTQLQTFLLTDHCTIW